MTSSQSSLGALAASIGGPAPSSVPRPRFRWSTRVLLPAAILAGVAGLLAYTGREALTPSVAVRVIPVVPRATLGAGEDAPTASAPVARPQTVVAQAPGWIEPAPFAINIPALTEGVVSEVLVLEGERVEKGQVVARLIDTDAELALRRSEAARAEAVAVVARARTEVLAASARLDEVLDELRRKQPLVESGAVTAWEVSRLELRKAASEQELAAMRAAVQVAEAAVGEHDVRCDEARLMLARTRIVAPASGVVLARMVEPGMRLNMTAQSGAEPRETGIIKIYDPASLQARVEVPLADAGKIAVGARAEVATETLPDRVFAAEVSRVVHTANIQRNTVQFKVAIRDPDPALKPEMLCRVKFYGAGGASVGAASASATGGAEETDTRLIIPAAALLDRAGDKARVWVADQSSGRPLAAVREVTLGADAGGGGIEVRTGLRPGDRLIASPPPNLRPGSRLSILGEEVAR